MTQDGSRRALPSHEMLPHALPDEPPLSRRLRYILTSLRDEGPANPCATKVASWNTAVKGQETASLERRGSFLTDQD
jgi:hypothetical protein